VEQEHGIHNFLVRMLTSHRQRNIAEYFLPGEIETISAFVMNPVASIRKQKIKSINERVKQLSKRR